jgi:hypothetical protein
MNNEDTYTPYLMAVDSGHVDTEENWLSEMPTWEIYTSDGNDFSTPEQEEEERQRQYNLLVRVKKVEGCWVEVYPTQKS